MYITRRTAGFFLLAWLILSAAAASAQGLAYEFETPGDTEGWTSAHATSELTAADGLLSFDITGHDPYIHSPAISVDAESYSFVFIRMKSPEEGAAEIFWTRADSGGFSADKAQVFNTGPAGAFGEYLVDLTETDAWTGTITRLRLDPSNTAESGSVAIDYVRFLAPSDVPGILKLVSFSSDAGFDTQPGNSFTLSAVIANAGGQPVTGVGAALTLPEGLSLLSGDALTEVGSLAPETQQTLTWTVQADAPLQGLVQLELSSAESDLISRSLQVVVLAPIPNEDWKPASGAGTRETDEALWLGNQQCRAVFAASPAGYGYTAFDVRLADGSWRRMALMQSFSRLIVDHGGDLEEIGVFVPDRSIESSGPEEAAVVFTGTWTDSAGDAWQHRFRFSLAADSDNMEVLHETSPAEDKQIRLFEGPILRIGAGSFGTARDAAILPGLEWVVGDEVSSSTLDVTVEEHLRYVPHTNKITCPAMSLLYDGTLIGLLWEQLAPWHEQSTQPSAVFSVPDQFDMPGTSSLMGLFVPSVPEHVRENERSAYQPYSIGAGEMISLSSRILLQAPAGSPLLAQDRWYEIYGILELLPYPRETLQEELKFSTASFMGPLWLEEEQAWTTHLEGWGALMEPQRPPVYLLWLELAARLVDDPALAASYRQRYDEAVAAGATENDLRLQYYVGDPGDTMLQQAGQMANLISQQEENGAWLYDRDPSLGPIGSEEVGLTAPNALRLAMFARMTGDPTVLAHAELALQSMMAFDVPRAAQTWEIAVHTPDLLAASYAVRAFLEGYRATGKQEYLDEAVYWARATLPFIYTWRQPGWEWMHYGTIPVFGATHFRAPVWFGRIVQWNGLHAAYSLLQLADYDSLHDWDQVGTGILLGGMYQQETRSDWLGTYRDVFDTLNGQRYGPLISPTLFMDSIFSKLGHDPTPSTTPVPVAGGAVYATSPGEIAPQEAANATDAAFAIAYLEGETTFCVVAQCTEPEAVTKNGAPLPRNEDLDAVAEGWRYVGSGFVSIKLAHGADADEIVLQGVQPRQTELVPEQLEEIRFFFNEDGVLEGWQPTNDLTGVTVGNGALRGAATGNDPYMIRNQLLVPADTAPTISIRMRNDGGSTAQFFWATQAEPSFSASRSLGFPVQGDGGFHHYDVDMSSHDAWTGETIVALRLDPPVGAGGEFAIDYIVGGDPPDVSGNDSVLLHDADTDANEAIGLAELLRVVQLAAADGYHCASGTEDGYAPGPGETEPCGLHDADYSAPEGRLTLSEVLRVIQLYNSAGYAACPDASPPTEDGFCLE